MVSRVAEPSAGKAFRVGKSINHNASIIGPEAICWRIDVDACKGKDVLSADRLPALPAKNADMFRVVDRYVFWQYLQVFVICFVSLTGLYIVIDAFGHLDHFVDHAKDNGGLAAVMGKYYGYRSLVFFDRTSGVLALIAAMFTVTWLQRHNEITALLAAGVPRMKVLRPVIVACVIVTLFTAAARELVMPGLRHELSLDSKNLAGDAAMDLQSRYDNETGILLGGEKITLGNQTIQNASFLLPRPLATYGKQLTAESAEYVPALEGRVGGYWLRGVASPSTLLAQPTLMIENKPAIITPKDASWLQPDEVFVVSNVSFELLAGGSKWRDFASTGELIEQLSSPSVELGSDVRVAVHSRLLHPLMDITLLFLGLPLVVSRGNNNPFIAIGLCILVVTGFFLVTLGGQSLGATGWLRPTLAAWLPLLVFIPIAVGLSKALRS